MSTSWLIAGCGNELPESAWPEGSDTTATEPTRSDDIATSTSESLLGSTSSEPENTALPGISAVDANAISRDEFASKFAEAASSGDSPFTNEQATCLGEKIYDEVGDERINELNDELEGDEFPQELVEPVAKAGPECVAAGDLMADQLGSAGLTAEQADCIVSGINDDPALNQQVWDAIAASAAGDDSKAAELEGAITKTATSCVGG
ncbi:MAG: hypothetical protein KDB24_17960 [Microthrixaceae bacterium]|nr:hypothetical protein [Microthrixaceae bacterium]